MVATQHLTLIQALHQRYEEAEAAAEAADKAQPTREADALRHSELQRVMDANMAEIDAVRALILRQMPIDDADLTILIFHAYMLSEFMTSQASPEEGDVKALFGAIRWAFDYLMCESTIGDGLAGPNMLAVAELARVACREQRYGTADEVAA